jgi:hypothetical protein
VNRIPERNRPLVIVATGLIVVLFVVGVVLLIGQVGPSPTPSTSLPPTATASPSADTSTPEGATRAFFDAVVAARRTDDPTAIEPFVTGTSASAYQTVAAFLAGQKDKHKASITTQLDLQGVHVTEAGDTAQLTATLLEAGYDVSLDSGQPLESPMTLAPRKLTVDLRRTAGAWKVESFETEASS